MDKPAIFGGEKEFDSFLPIIKPSLPTLSQISDSVQEILKTGMITNFSKYVLELENNCRKFLGTNFVSSQSNGTSGLLLTLKSLGLTGEVIVPSFTFSATVHVLKWCNLEPVFVDIDPETYNINPALIEEKITDKTSAILAVHIFGNPCDVEELERIAKKHNLKLIFDAAHAFGSLYQGKKIGGFGNAEVFSSSVTKLLVTGEGGLVSTNNSSLNDKIKLARNYGASGDYNCLFVGYNSKMQEFSAILGLHSLQSIEKQIIHRNKLRELFIGELKNILGISFQKIKQGNQTTVKDFSIVIDKNKFGMDRNFLSECLAAENIGTKKYFYPPVHMMDAYQELKEKYFGKLPNTEYISNNILCLPIYSEMPEETVKKICHAIKKIHQWNKNERVNTLTSHSSLDTDTNNIFAINGTNSIKRVLITGGAGYVGIILTKKLLERGYKVRVLDQLIYGKESLKEVITHTNFSLEVGVVEDKYIVEKCLKDVDAVIHLAGLSNDPSCELDAKLTKKANIDSTKILLKLSKEKGVKRFINASSCSVYGYTGEKIVNEESPLNPLTEYAKSKVKSEELCLSESNENFVTVSLRKSTVYGPSPRMRFDLVVNTMTGMVMSEGKIIINGGEQWRPFLHVNDAADAYVFMLEAPKEKINGKIFNVGSNEQNFKIMDIANKIAKIIPNTEIEQSPSPDKRSYLVNFDKIHSLGWKPKYSIEEGILGVKKLFEDGTVTNFRDINYFNIKRMLSFLNI